jgi:hypothetical protein
VDVPIEFVSVTETVPIAVVSPEYVNGMVSENIPPFATPQFAAVSENHAIAAAVSETVNWLPFNCVPEAAVNVRLALVRSRGVELPSRNTEKPVAVMLMILTDPGTMAGARRPTVMVAVTGFAGSTDWPVAVVNVASLTTIVPATVPN